MRGAAHEPALLVGAGDEGAAGTDAAEARAVEAGAVETGSIQCVGAPTTASAASAAPAGEALCVADVDGAIDGSTAEDDLQSPATHTTAASCGSDEDRDTDRGSDNGAACSAGAGAEFQEAAADVKPLTRKVRVAADVGPVKRVASGSCAAGIEDGGEGGQPRAAKDKVPKEGQEAPPDCRKAATT